MHRVVEIKEKAPHTWLKMTAQLEQHLHAAITADGAAKGNVQLLNPYVDGLEIVAHRGFDKSFLQHFNVVRWDEPTACGRAFRFGQRVVIRDITVDRFYAPFLSIAEASGYRAVQSTPIIRPDGRVIGVLSTHFPETHDWTETSQAALDHSAAQMGLLIAELIQTSVR